MVPCWFSVGSRLLPSCFLAGSQQLCSCFASDFARNSLLSCFEFVSRTVGRWLATGSKLVQGWLTVASGLPQGWIRVGSPSVCGCFPDPVLLLWGGRCTAVSWVLGKSVTAGQALVRDWVSDGSGLAQGRLVVGLGLVPCWFSVGSRFD